MINMCTEPPLEMAHSTRRYRGLTSHPTSRPKSGQSLLTYL
jgi:hypothetical protein